MSTDLDLADETIEFPAVELPAVQRGRRGSVITRCLAAAVGVLAITVAAIVAGRAIQPVPAAAGSPAAIRLYDWHGREPIGITLSGLQAYLLSEQNITIMEHQMRAAKLHWHANTIRLQILQDKLVGATGRNFRPQYMNYVRQLASYGLHLGLTVVINAQTEMSVGYGADEPLPTRATYAFWSQMMRHYRSNPRVVFDLFNEPRKTTWGQWDDAFQGLIDYVRGAGATNTIWVEGRWWGSTLQGAPLLRDPLRRVVYTFHHPGAPWDWQVPPTPATWDRAFGNLADRGVPVIDGEFANYVGSYHWPHSARTVRRYFAYLTAHHVPMLAWSLLPGALNSTGDYASVSHQPQGDGAQVRRLFAAVASQASR